ncbi:MAG: DUF4332 domain-containing protein [Promethearchaeota archaeon]
MVEYTLSRFESIGMEYAKRLEKGLNIKLVDDYYKYDAEKIHEKTKIEEKRLKQFSEIFDLFRIPNMTPREAELLYYININSVEELSHRQAVRIYYKLKEIDVKTYFIILELPTFAKIDRWIYFAKILTKRIKYGINIPLILFPMVTIDNVSELQNYQIWTLEDFEIKSPLISGLRGKINMTRSKYLDLQDMIEMVKIGGIDVYFASVFLKAGIKKADELKDLENNEILRRVKEIQDKEKNCPEVMDLEDVLEIKQNIGESR